MENAREETHVERDENSGNGIRKLVHQLNNHLTLVMGHGQLLLDRTHDQQMINSLTQIVAEAQKASQVARDLLSFVRSRGPVCS